MSFRSFSVDSFCQDDLSIQSRCWNNPTFVLGLFVTLYPSSNICFVKLGLPKLEHTYLECNILLMDCPSNQYEVTLTYFFFHQFWFEFCFVRNSSTCVFPRSVGLEYLIPFSHSKVMPASHREVCLLEATNKSFLLFDTLFVFWLGYWDLIFRIIVENYILIPAILVNL